MNYRLILLLVVLQLVASAGVFAHPMPEVAVRAEVASVPPVRVMSFNIRYGTAADGENHWLKRRDFLIETIAAFEPDLLGTQETLADQRDFLAQKLEGYQVWAAGRDDGRDMGEMAALYYREKRFEKLAGGHFWLSDTPEKPGSKGWDAALPRIATWVKLRDRSDPTGPPVLFLNTHLDHRGKKARYESARLIQAKLAELGQGCRIVVTGDFNAAEGSEPYTALFAPTEGKPSPLIDTFRVQHPNRGKNEGTFSGFKATATTGERIDWIACSRDWQVRLAGIDHTARDGRTPSDHFPVTAVLRPRLAGEKPTLRILCYNIHHGEGTDGQVNLLRQARVIRAADPDFVALQEVDDQTRRTGGVDQTAELARLTGLFGRFGKARDYDGGGYGQAILSRVPVEAGTVHSLPGMPGRERRIAFEVQLTLEGRELTFVTTHLDHQLPLDREQQATRLNELYGKSKRPVILAGDLNAVPDSKPLKILAEQWTVTSANRELLSFPADKPNRLLDYVLFRPTQAFRILDVQILDESVASDHRPVLVVLEPLKN